MTEILFGQSYYPRFDPKIAEADQLYPPLGTLYAASYLRSRGYGVAVFDAMLADSESAWDKALEREAPRYAVLYEDSFNYLSKMCLLRMREAAFSMFRMARVRGCTVIACGSDATDRAEEYLANGADFVIVGEGEQTLSELMDHLSGRNRTPLEQIQGLIFRGPGGAPARTGARMVLKELDTLPLPARDLVDLSRYRSIWRKRHGYFSLNVATTRGCPYHCNWCAKPIWGQRYNVRSPENVIEELRLIQQEHHPDHIWFADDIFGLKPGWVERFADLVESEAVNLPFKCLSRADLLLRNGTVEALHRAHCQIVWIGAESGSQKILDAMEKGIRVEQVYEAARRLRAIGIQVGFFLQFGYPGETRQDIELTLKMVRECAPDDIGVSVSYPLPGTKFYRSVEAELGSRENWVDSGDLAMLFRGPFTTAFYRKLHTVLHREFRMRRAWRELGRGLREPSTFRTRHLRQSAAMVSHAFMLPIERRRLEKLATVPHQPTAVRQKSLSLEAAARPSPQEE